MKKRIVILGVLFLMLFINILVGVCSGKELDVAVKVVEDSSVVEENGVVGENIKSMKPGISGDVIIKDKNYINLKGIPENIQEGIKTDLSSLKLKSRDLIGLVFLIILFIIIGVIRSKKKRERKEKKKEKKKK